MMSSDWYSSRKNRIRQARTSMILRIKRAEAAGIPYKPRRKTMLKILSAWERWYYVGNGKKTRLATAKHNRRNKPVKVTELMKVTPPPKFDLSSKDGRKAYWRQYHQDHKVKRNAYRREWGRKNRTTKSTWRKSPAGVKWLREYRKAARNGTFVPKRAIYLPTKTVPVAPPATPTVLGRLAGFFSNLLK